LSLAPEERAALAEKLLESVDSLEQDKIEAAWAEKAKRRIEAYRQGKMKLLSVSRLLNRSWTRPSHEVVFHGGRGTGAEGS
jgi:putative addiction module component (TIGR02574 family)